MPEVVDCAALRKYIFQLLVVATYGAQTSGSWTFEGSWVRYPRFTPSR